jgi:hypothetical protein
MSKQTAVEWLVKEFSEILGPIKTGDMQHLLLVDAIKRAKQMEKEQIIDACNLQRNDYKGMPTYNKSGEQYYNETYGDK